MTAPHQREERAGFDLRLLRAAVFTAVCVALSAASHQLASVETVPLWTLAAGFLVLLAVVVPLAGRTRSLPGVAALLAVGQIALHTLFGLGQHGTAAASASAGPSDASLVQQAARLVCGAGAVAIGPAQARRLLAGVGGGQGVGAGAGSGTGSGTGAGMGHASGAMDAMGAMGTAGSAGMAGSAAGDASASSMASMPAMALLPSLPMLLGHLLAALATGWLLRRGDLALFRLVRLSAHGVAEGALVRALRGAFALVRALLAGLSGAPDAAPQVPRTDRRAVPKPRTAALQHSVIRRGPPAGAAALVLAG
ncbi:hypothetical protein ACFVT5_26850 [Streptomyces sp. NPDC058001]|uniref:hypothetical protein n=1 Tax=Streptomyces sp. NPDC058001 TaxID=3346300 RepID=UPI0036E5F631